MKNLLIYLLGIITGILLSMFFPMQIAHRDSQNNTNVEVAEDEDIYSNAEEIEAIDDTLNDPNKILFDQPGECVSRRSFEVQEVLQSGDAVAQEIREMTSFGPIMSDLEVLILADENSHFYNKQIVKAPQGKYARQIGTYRKGYNKVIPIVAF